MCDKEYVESSENNCFDNKTEGACAAGTEIKYKVNDSNSLYFYVLYDDGNSVTMISKDEIGKSTYNENTDLSANGGPTSAWALLNNNTVDWTNVSSHSYSTENVELKYTLNEYEANEFGNTLYEYIPTESNVTTANRKVRLLTAKEVIDWWYKTIKQYHYYEIPSWVPETWLESTGGSSPISIYKDSSGNKTVSPEDSNIILPVHGVIKINK